MTRRFVPGLVALGFGGLVAMAAFQFPRSGLPAPIEAPETPSAIPVAVRSPIGPVETPLAPEPRPADALIARIGDGRLRHWGHVFRTRFHPNGRWVAATAVGENGVRIGDTHSGEQVRRYTDRDLDPFENTRSNCSVLLFTPDGRLVVGTEDGRVVAFNADTGEVTARFKADGFYTWDLGVSPAGRYVAGFDTARRLAVWDIDTGEKSFTGPKCEGKKVYWSRHGSACFSPDGKHVAVCKTPEVVWYSPLAGGTVGREVSASSAAGKDGLLNLEWNANNRLVAQGARRLGPHRYRRGEGAFAR